MGARGRKSMAELMVPAALAEVIRRPEAPDDLTVEQGDEWCAIVGAMPPHHFTRGNYPMLSQLCRHIVCSRRIAQLIEQVTTEKVLDLKELSALLQLQSAESASITRLSRSMRLTQQSIMRAETTRHPTAQLARPWVDEE
ncbi:MAG: hypothetical protein C0480_04255 [Bradyrhizobium sp.]|nr:hypothetical protein [Bradyrhizobium sp.]